MSIRAIFQKPYWILNAQFGIDPRKTMRAISGLPRYIRDYYRFSSSYDGRLELRPCLHDWHAEGGSTKEEYFWQDLLVARMIFETKPEKHVDIGSRIDGFVAHVASFREIEVFDIRPITTQIPGVIFKQADLMKPCEGMTGYCDSLSCLHALEHFGLGRYGDKICTDGFERGFINMARLVKNGGQLYLSVPIGIARVEFNANYIFDPNTIINLALGNSLKLTSILVIGQRGKVEKFSPDRAQLANLANQHYALGIFLFVKSS